MCTIWVGFQFRAQYLTVVLSIILTHLSLRFSFFTLGGNGWYMLSGRISERVPVVIGNGQCSKNGNQEYSKIGNKRAVKMATRVQ